MNNKDFKLLLNLLDEDANNWTFNKNWPRLIEYKNSIQIYNYEISQPVEVKFTFIQKMRLFFRIKLIKKRSNAEKIIEDLLKKLTNDLKSKVDK